jgi:hypothetical protein
MAGRVEADCAANLIEHSYARQFALVARGTAFEALIFLLHSGSLPGRSQPPVKETREKRTLHNVAVTEPAQRFSVEASLPGPRIEILRRHTCDIGRPLFE